MKEKTLKSLKTSSLITIIICAVSFLLTVFWFTGPVETLVLLATLVYFVIAYAKMQGKKVEVKDLKNLLLFINIFVVCYNLLSLNLNFTYISWRAIEALIMITFFIVNTLYIYQIFKGKVWLSKKVYNIAAILHAALFIVLTICSGKISFLADVAMAVTLLVATKYFNDYCSVTVGKEEHQEETLSILGIDEDFKYRELSLGKKVLKLVGYIVLAILFAILSLPMEYMGVYFVIVMVLFVAPLLYIYRLGNAINEPKGMLYVSYFIPLVGLILYLIYVRNVKALGNACGKSALLNLIMPVITFILIFAISLSSVINNVSNVIYPF